MPFRSPQLWTAALAAQRFYWSVDRTYVVAMCGPNATCDKIWTVAAAFKVARNFPTQIREEAKAILCAGTINSFDSFVQHARERALAIHAIGAETRRFFAISGVSKLLWHRFPWHGFIYDEQARTAIVENGYGAPFYNRVAAWGGPPRNAADCMFLSFAAAYQKYCLPAIRLVEPRLPRIGGEPQITRERTVYAIRVVDKLLWLAGEAVAQRQRTIARWNKAATADDRRLGKQLAEGAAELLRGIG